jgi:hypothetical protein
LGTTTYSAKAPFLVTPHGLEIQAVVVLVDFAEVAVVAKDIGIGSHPLPWGELGHTLSHRRHLSRELMPCDDRETLEVLPPEDVDICPTDSRHLHPDENLLRAGTGVIDFNDPPLFLSFKDARPHLSHLL